MDKPKITYHVLNADDTYTKQNSVYAGTYTGDEELSVSLRIWNNYRGTEDVEDLENFNVVLRFLTEEDSALLKYIAVADTRDYGKALSPVYEDGAAVFMFQDPVILSGGANTGSDQDIDNFVGLTVSFKTAAGAYLKDHDLKSLVLDIVEL